MSLDPTNYLRIISDAFTPVRDQSGRLLGCIPRVSDDAVFAGPFPLMIAAQACAVVALDQPGTPPITTLPGFVAFDDRDADLATPVGEDDPAQGM
jgi:hypothetical protein